MKKCAPTTEFRAAGAAHDVKSDCPGCQGAAVVYTDGCVFCIDCGVFEPEAGDGQLFYMRQSAITNGHCHSGDVRALLQGHRHDGQPVLSPELLACGHMQVGSSLLPRTGAESGSAPEAG